MKPPEENNAPEAGLSRLARSSLRHDGIEVLNMRQGRPYCYYTKTPEGRALKARHASMKPREIRADVEQLLAARKLSSNMKAETRRAGE